MLKIPVAKTAAKVCHSAVENGRASCPETLFIRGNKDFFGPPSEGQEMAAVALRARCEVVADAGHAVWFGQEVPRCLLPKGRDDEVMPYGTIAHPHGRSDDFASNHRVRILAP